MNVKYQKLLNVNDELFELVLEKDVTSLSLLPNEDLINLAFFYFEHKNYQKAYLLINKIRMYNIDDLCSENVIRLYSKAKSTKSFLFSLSAFHKNPDEPLFKEDISPCVIFSLKHKRHDFLSFALEKEGKDNVYAHSVAIKVLLMHIRTLTEEDTSKTMEQLAVDFNDVIKALSSHSNIKWNKFSKFHYFNQSDYSLLLDNFSFSKEDIHSIIISGFSPLHYLKLKFFLEHEQVKNTNFQFNRKEKLDILSVIAKHSENILSFKMHKLKDVLSNHTNLIKLFDIELSKNAHQHLLVSTIFSNASVLQIEQTKIEEVLYFFNKHNIDINAQDQKGRTFLHNHSLLQERFMELYFYQDLGCNLEIKDHENNSIHDILAKSGYQTLSTSLINHKINADQLALMKTFLEQNNSLNRTNKRI